MHGVFGFLMAGVSPEPPSEREVPPLPPHVAMEILFLGEAGGPSRSCISGNDGERIGCGIRLRYANDSAARRVALDLYARTGTVVGLLPEQDFAGGYRGVVHLVPRLPVGTARKHLQWTAAALLDYDDFFRRLGGAPNFRWLALALRFFRSPGRRTPSAFATDWTIAYNVNGSLFGSATGVRGTLFHEIFHLNDAAHGRWSARALAPTFDAIVAKCGVRTACLARYTPASLMVKGGTYYAFQPGNGVREYGAELARRYYEEQRAVLHGGVVSRPFKCAAPENLLVWSLLVREFFGGVDRVGACKADPVSR